MVPVPLKGTCTPKGGTQGAPGEHKKSNFTDNFLFGGTRLPKDCELLILTIQNQKPTITFLFAISRLTGGIVLLVLITYIPYLAQWQLDILVHRDISLMTTGTLAFSWVGRCLMQINR